MSYTLPAGGSLAIASTYATAVNMTAITNATEAVATLGASHGLVVGDIIEVTSGWELLNKRVVRVKTVDTNDITFEGINTLNTTFYPATEGVGTVRKITAFTTITQVGGISFTGGDQQFADTSTIFGRTDTQMPASRTPVVAEITIHDDPSLPFYSVIKAAEDAGNPVAMRITGGNGARTYHNGFWSMAQFATLERNATEKRAVSFTAVAEPTRYAA
jgi:hypothetical protein